MVETAEQALALHTRDLPGPDVEAGDAIRVRAARVIRPAGAFARLDELAAWVARWQGTDRPAARRARTLIFAADHGVVTEGVSAYPADITAAMLHALRGGTATASILGQVNDVGIDVYDVGVGRPTANIAEQDALSHERFGACLRAGIDAVCDAGSDLLVLGEMGIGNTTPAAAICAALHEGEATDWTGPGSGVGGAALKHKLDVVERARRRLGGEQRPAEILRRLGGSELVAIAGAILEARRRRIPVLLDGYVVTTAAGVLNAIDVRTLDHCRVAHLSPEPGHAALVHLLGQQPLLDLGLRLGEGTGAILAVPLVRAAIAAVLQVPTFEEIGIAG